MSDDRVVSLTGGPVPQQKADELVVEALERMAERARAGDVVGFAICVTHSDGGAGFHLEGIWGYAMLGALQMAQADIIASMADD